MAQLPGGHAKHADRSAGALQRVVGGRHKKNNMFIRKGDASASSCDSQCSESSGSSGTDAPLPPGVGPADRVPAAEPPLPAPPPPAVELHPPAAAEPLLPPPAGEPHEAVARPARERR
eukprot:11166076-Lingulodinium_polyedra.AAC.1